MDSSEVYKQYKSAKERFHAELYAIQRAYISSHYAFKRGDVVIFKNYFHKNPTLMVIDSIYFSNNGDYANEYSYRNPKVQISGHEVDEEGYDRTFFRDSTQAIDVCCDADDVVKVTNIRPKGLKRR